MKKLLLYIFILVAIIGLFNPAEKVSAVDDGTCTITDPVTKDVLVREMIEKDCTDLNLRSPNSAVFNAYSISNQRPAPTSSPTPYCTGIDAITGDITPPGCSGWQPAVLTPAPTTATQAATDLKYTLLAPLPCPPGAVGCDSNKLLRTFDPTGAGGGAFGGYLNLMIKIFISICAVLAVIMIVMGGIEYMTTELISSKEAGKERIRNAIFGLLLALGAWTLLNQINPKLLDTALESLKDVTVEVTIEDLGNSSYSSTGGAGTGGDASSCVVQTDQNNACSPAKLASSCFGNRAEEASKICSAESRGGSTDVSSGSDLLDNGSGPSYSVGLWQINLTVHQVGGLNCPAAFSGTCGPGTATPNKKGPFVGGPKVGNCSQRIVNQTLYDQCVAAAKDSVKNTTVACGEYNRLGNFKPWEYSANKCGVPLN